MQAIEAEESLVGKALKLLFKGLDDIIRADIAEKEKIEKEGKVGLRYTFPLEKHPKAYMVAEIWPVKGQKDMWYVDRVYGKGKLSDGSAMPAEKFGSHEWTPKTIDGEDLISEIETFMDYYPGDPITPIGKPKDDPEKISVKDRDQTPEEAEVEETETAEEVEECIKVRAKLQRIQGSTEITYTAIDATCDPNTAMNMLCDVIDCPEFAEQITEEPVVVEVVDLGEDGLDANIIDEEVDTSTTPASLEAAKAELIAAINKFVDFISVYSVNFDEDQQETLAEWSEKLADEKELLGEGRLE